MTTSAVGLGSNLGDRIGHLRAAVRGIAAVAEITAVSRVYETEPVGGPDQGPYLNAAVVIETAHTPDGLLEELFVIERSRGRMRRVRWGPRTLDLDILLWGDETVDEPGLTVPHPRMLERRFVLEPLLAVWPDARLPDGSPIAGSFPSVTDQDLSPTPLAIVRV